MAGRDEVRERVVTRAAGRCEAERWVRGRWRRCSRPGTDLHHMVTKARGGRNLDRVGETYHLLLVCRECHGLAHDEADADLLISGSVTWDRLEDRPVYVGPDPYLTERYGGVMDVDHDWVMVGYWELTKDQIEESERTQEPLQLSKPDEVQGPGCVHCEVHWMDGKDSECPVKAKWSELMDEQEG